jgi:KDO2-lipid IV(A) lauroyltransferase
MKAPPLESARCGLDTVETARVERLLADFSAAELASLFSRIELEEAGVGPGRAAALAARFAAKEACCKLFPRETALGTLTPADFSIRRDTYGAPAVEPNLTAEAVLNRHRVSLRVSLTHTETTASAIAWAVPNPIRVPWIGKVLYHVLPLRRAVVLSNLRRVFAATLPEADIRRIAQTYYAHFASFFTEFFRTRLMSAERRRAWVRVENKESPIAAHREGKGLLLLTGHFGNWEVSTVEGIAQFPQYRGLFHFVRRPLKPRWLNELVNRRFRRAGFGTLAKRGSLDTILDLLSHGAIVVFVFDQHAGRKEAVAVDFFGHTAHTFKSLAVLALSTGAPVIPVSSWREPDGSHTLRFEDPLPRIERENTTEAIRLNTQAYNTALEQMLLRHPEQWIWMHRRWKTLQ